jgi:hypothetical protein
MKCSIRFTFPAVLAILLTVWSGVPAMAQEVLEGTEELAFDRTESWAMKYYASLTLFTGMGVPDKMGKGTFDLGFEGGFVPELSEDQRRVGFEGTKVEDLNRTSFIGRARGRIGVSENYSLELGYIPPIELDGVKANIFSAAFGRPFQAGESFRLGVRGFGQIGTIKGDITCSAREIEEGPNDFLCEEPSNDEQTQRLLGVEVTGGYVSEGPLRPYFGVGFNYMDLEFQVDARYSGVEDHMLQTTSGGTVSLTGGVNYVATENLRLTGELFYSWLSVVRPPSTSSENDGLFNFRFLVTYRFP